MAAWDLSYLFILIGLLLAAYRGSRVAIVFTAANFLAWHIPDGLLLGFWYYAGSALVDLALIFAVLRLPHSRLSCPLATIGLFSIISNAVGWVLWFCYFPPALYDWSQTVIYFAVCLIITSNRCADGLATFTRGVTHVFGYCHSCLAVAPADKTEGRP